MQTLALTGISHTFNILAEAMLTIELKHLDKTHLQLGNKRSKNGQITKMPYKTTQVISLFCCSPLVLMKFIKKTSVHSLHSIDNISGFFFYYGDSDIWYKWMESMSVFIFMKDSIYFHISYWSPIYCADLNAQQ